MNKYKSSLSHEPQKILASLYLKSLSTYVRKDNEIIGIIRNNIYSNNSLSNKNQ